MGGGLHRLMSIKDISEEEDRVLKILGGLKDSTSDYESRAPLVIINVVVYYYVHSCIFFQYKSFALTFVFLFTIYIFDPLTCSHSKYATKGD